jgi:hypothetical protein
MNRFFALLCIALPVLVLSSCTAYREVEFKGVKQTRFTGFNASGVSCEFDVELFNPNPYKISLISSEVDLFMEGTRLGHVALPVSAVENGPGRVYAAIAKRGRGIVVQIVENQCKNELSQKITAYS